MKIAEAFVEVRADTSKFGPALAKDAEAGATKAGAGIKRALAGAVAVAGAGLFLKGAFSEFEEAERSAKQLEQTIRSTGGAANVTAGYASDLADNISKASVVDDEVVAGAERMLLTFKEIKNTEVDKTFDRATQAAVDLAAALGTDAEGAAIQLGKALNDPLKGITALQRAGVSFSAQQKEQIALFVQQGETAKAQGIILSEVESQFGGQAAAAATEADKARIAFANLQESVGGALAPAMETAAKAVTVLSEAFSAQPVALQQIEILATGAAIAYAKFNDPVRAAVRSLSDFGSEASTLKGTLGKAGLAGAAIVAGVALAQMSINLRASQLEKVSGSIDDIAASLALVGAEGTVNLDDLVESFEQLDKSFSDGRSFVDKVIDAFGQADQAYLEFSAKNKAAAEDIDKVDKALANLYQSGNAAGARQAFQQISDTLKEQGVSSEEIAARFDDYAGAVKQAGNASAIAADGTDALGTAADEAKTHIKSAAEVLADWNDELDKYLGKALDPAEATDRIAQGFIDLADAVKEVRDQPGKQGLPDFQANTPAALNYREQIRGLVEDYGTLIKTTSANQGESDLLAESFRRQAEALGLPQEEIDKYTELLLGIPPDAETEVRQEGMAKSLTDTSELARRLGDVDGTVVRGRVDVDVQQALIGIAALKRAIEGLPARAGAAFAQANFAAGGRMIDGWNVVGEEGPELVSKSGSQVEVFSNARSREMAGVGSRGGGGGTVVNVTVHGLVVGTERELASQLARLLESLD